MTEEPEKRTLKQKIEDNVVILLLSTAAACFVAGWGAHAAVAGTLNSSRVTPPEINWQATAAENGWMDKNSCPALPVTLRILSPGDRANIRFRAGDLHSEFVVNSSQPLPGTDSVGLVFHAEGDPNFYTSFPHLEVNNARALFRDNVISLPFDVTKPTQIEIWALVIGDRNQMGSLYGGLEQIKAVSPTIFLSDKVTVTAMPIQ
jgi:hypothetical protein